MRISFVDRIIGGWEVSGVIVSQTGPFMTITRSRRPVWYRVQHIAGRRAGGHGVRGFALRRPIAQPVDQSQRLCRAAEQYRPFRRFAIGSVVGPGENVVSLSLLQADCLNGARSRCR